MAVRAFAWWKRSRHWILQEWTRSCQDLIRIIKTIYLRKRARKEAGRKETAVDARYFRIAEDHLYGELAVALDMSRENVESYINTSLQSV